MNRFLIIFLFITNMMILAGCTEHKILERTSLTTLLGYDLAEDDQLKVTAAIRQINPDLESNVEIQSATDKTSRGARTKVDLKTSKKIGSGQLRVLLFGESLAKAGLEDSIHAVKMNPEVSNAIYLAVVEGESNSLIENNYQNITDIGQHIFQLMEHNIEQQNVLSSTLHEVNRDYLSGVVDISIPMLKKVGEYIEISGIALFKEGTMVGSLPIKDAIYIKLIRDDLKKGTLELALPASTIESATSNSSEEVEIAIDSIKSKRKNKLVDPTVPEFDLIINLETRLISSPSNLHVTDSKSEDKLEKEINKKIETEVNRVIQYSQKVNSDIFGFGKSYKAQVRNTEVDEETWHEMYPHMKVNVKVSTQIVRDGVFQ
ncbi:Ger(x)C family spore germination protein [Ureibacillus sp. NPDC094379]